MLRKDPRILYFHTSVKPTKEEQAFAESLSSGVMYRNANIKNNGSLEPCDGVAGDAPDEYKAKYPVVSSREDAIAAREKLLTAADNVADKEPAKSKDPAVAIAAAKPDRKSAKAPAKTPTKKAAKGWAANK